MSATPSDYRKAYEASKRELTTLLQQQETIGKRLLVVRESIQALAALCESEGVKVEHSPEATYLLVSVSLADEIRVVLRAMYPLWLRPNEIKNKLARLGHDMSKYRNPQATIQMVLKRMVESNDAEEMTSKDGKKIYRCPLVATDAVKALKELEQRKLGKK